MLFTHPESPLHTSRRPPGTGPAVTRSVPAERSRGRHSGGKAHASGREPPLVWPQPNWLNTHGGLSHPLTSKVNKIEDDWKERRGKRNSIAWPMLSPTEVPSHLERQQPRSEGGAMPPALGPWQGGSAALTWGGWRGRGSPQSCG